MKLAKLASVILIFSSAIGFAQLEVKTEQKGLQFGNGLQLNLNDGDLKLNLGGFIQGVFKNEKVESEKASNFFNARYTFLTVSGSMYKDKISFLLQNNFSSSKPLLDAWVAYSPISNLKISFGQKQTFTNNREMTFFEDKLQFVDRGIFSSEFSNSGREFGLFLEGQIGKDSFIIKPKIAITSGDGINSFGTNSTDVDNGGLKLGGRLDLFPLGNFKAGNDGYIADLLHEETLKVLVGGAFSYNKGASNEFGEGHSDFTLYGLDKKEKLPDYRKIYGDILLKYNGFSLLAEYVNTSAASLDGIFTNATATNPLFPTQISNFLVLGDGMNVQTGYVTKSGYSLDLKYEKLTSEFETNSSILRNQDAYTLGLAKYLKGNNLRVQASISQRNSDNFNVTLSKLENVKTITGQLSFQVVF